MLSRGLLYLASLFNLYRFFLTEKFWWKTFGNSDYLYAYSYFQSLTSFSSILDWNFPPSLYLFPDLLLAGISYYLLQIFQRLTPELHFIGTIFLFQISTAYLIAKLILQEKFESNKLKRSLKPDSKKSIKYFFHTLIVFSLLNYSTLLFEFNLDQILYTNHNGIVILFLLTIYSIQTRNFYLLTCIIILGTISDSMYFFLFLIYLWTMKDSIPFTKPSNSKSHSFFQKKYQIIFSLVALFAISLPHLGNYLEIISISQAYFTKYLSFNRLNSNNLIAVLELIFEILFKYWFYFIILLYVLYHFLKRNSNSHKSISYLGIGNLLLVAIYLCFSRFFAWRYLPMFQFVLIWKIAQSKWRRFYFLVSLVLGVVFFWNQSYLGETLSEDRMPYLQEIESIYQTYPESVLCLDYWKARPITIYSKKIPKDHIKACDSKGNSLNWIESKERYYSDTKIEIEIKSKEYQR